jgi:hypothetical protein
VSHRSAIRCLALATGIALVAVIGLLWAANGGASGVRAFDSPVDAVYPPHRSRITATWTLTDPVSTLIPRDGTTWSIAQYGVTITFPLYAVSNDAVFTFTPQSGVAPGPPLVPTYPFELIGTYTSGYRVSLQRPITIVLGYDLSELDGAEEASLRFYYYNQLNDRWDREPSSVDLARREAQCTTRQSGRFLLAGYRFQNYVPGVLQAGASGVDSVGPAGDLQLRR